MKELYVSESLILPNGKKIKNRFFKSAMSEALATKKHAPSALINNLYRRWAEGGAGIVVTGNVMVDRNSLGEPGNVVIEDTRDLSQLKAWAKAGTKNNTELWMQLNHPGKQSPKSLSKKPVAPSAIPLKGHFKNFFNPPRELTRDEIKQLVSKFVKAAEVAKLAGFTGVQIHAAHGYLISQFLSPYDNQRTDDYGGSSGNRMRFLVEIYKGIREATGNDFSVAIKINAKDFKEEGLSEEASLVVIKKLASLGIDLVEISGGNYENPVMSSKSSGKSDDVFFLELAKKIKNEVSVPIVVTGGFRSLNSMENALKENMTAMIGLARPLALYPDIPKQIFLRTYQTVKTPYMKLGLKSLDEKYGAIIGISYYEQQIKRLAKDKKVKIHSNGWRPLLHAALAHGPSTLIRRRA